MNLKDKLQEYNIKDISKAIVIHEIYGIVILFGFWRYCYIYQPSQKVKLQIEKNKKLQEKFLKAKNRIQIIKQYNFFKNQNIKKLIISYAESSVLRFPFKPITIPLKLYLTWKTMDFL